MKIAIPLSLIVVFSMIACTKPRLPVQAKLPTENAPALELNLDGFTDVDTAFIKNDPQVDFVVSGYQPKESKFFEYWIKDNKLSATFSFPIFDINYRWLQDLDGDGKSEIIRAQGFEDGIDYSISKLEDAQEVLLLVFNPVLRDQTRPGQFFWGYPWDVKNVVTDKGYQLLSSLGNPDERDDNYFLPASQKQLPYILFEGATTQPDMVVQGIQPFEHRTLATILEEVMSNKSDTPIKQETTKLLPWTGGYRCNFLRLPEEHADPRAYDMIYLFVQENSISFKLDSYVEIVDRQLVVANIDQNTLSLIDPADDDFKIIIENKAGQYRMTSSFMNNLMGNSGTYILQKE